MRAFTTVLVANRSEIACRIIVAAKERGYTTVAAYSDADRNARHVRLADRAVRIGPAPASQSYLSIDALMAAAKRAGADAVHPGYGFLSENADFADACEAAGLTFIGPSPVAIRAMGNKGAAKRLMIAAGVPCVPGYQGSAQDDATLSAEAARIGFPIMVKAAAGGGGRGMRLVSASDDLASSVASARSEAQNAFGSDELILERAIMRPRHVEVQIASDAQGNTCHLGERDCSVQRRHQKVIEEAPSPAMSHELREKMGHAAVEAARSINYLGVGTIEFLLDESGKFYFLEMNTRVQVEHPVTELVTGIDIVGLQFDLAAGHPLPFKQSEVAMSGHAIEARLYAEDPAAGFLPQTGRILRWKPPTGEGVRVDHGLVGDDVITPYYDPMLAKIIAWGETREDARRRLVRGLEETILLGVKTNKRYLADILRHPAFIAGNATTGFVHEHGGDLTSCLGDRAAVTLALAAALLVDLAGPDDEQRNWWSTGSAVSLLTLRDDQGDRQVKVQSNEDGYVICVDGSETSIAIVERRDHHVRFIANNRESYTNFALDGSQLYLEDDACSHCIDDITFRPAEVTTNDMDATVRAPMNGIVRAVHAEPGGTVRKNEILLIIEAMKMEHQIVAPFDGIVEGVAVERGVQVATRDPLVTLKRPEESSL